MNRYNNYFYLSGFISLFLFTFFMSIILFMMLTSDKNKIFAIKKDNYISVSIDISSTQLKKTTPIIKKELVEKEKTPIKELIKPVVKKTKTITKRKNVNVESLFSDVWTKSIKTSKKVLKKTNSKRIQEIQSKISKSKVHETKSVSDLFENIKTANNTDKASTKSSALEVNEYLAKIQALVYKYFYPPQNSQGNSVEAIIELSAIGKIKDFRILKYSTSQTLNDECDNIKQRLINVVFPKNPDNKSGIYTILLTSKG